jgi:hypothetical protein
VNKATFVNGSVIYFGDGYEFQMASETYHKHTTLIIKPLHLKILKNNTGRSNTKLKEHIVSGWFAEENEVIREHNNKVSRQRRRATR